MGKPVNQKALHARLAMQDTAQFFIFALVAEIMDDTQIQEILQVQARRLQDLGFSKDVIEAQLDQFADNVYIFKSVTQRKNRKEN